MVLDPVTAYQSDHDLLLRLDERTLFISTALTTLTESISKKADDHENRIRWLEQRGWMLSGGVVVVSTFASFLISRFLK